MVDVFRTDLFRRLLKWHAASYFDAKRLSIEITRYVLPFFQKLAPWLVGIEACASSHHWSRELQALGHTVRLMPPL